MSSYIEESDPRVLDLHVNFDEFALVEPQLREWVSRQAEVAGDMPFEPFSVVVCKRSSPTAVKFRNRLCRLFVCHHEFTCSSSWLVKRLALQPTLMRRAQ